MNIKPEKEELHPAPQFWRLKKKEGWTRGFLYSQKLQLNYETTLEICACALHQDVSRGLELT